MSNVFKMTEEEKKKILEKHKDATKNHYVKKDETKNYLVSKNICMWGGGLPC